MFPLPRIPVFLLAVAFASGCASLAKKTPTPAAHVDAKELSQLQPPPNQRYYLLFWGSESNPKKAKATHTWATLVTTTDIPGSAEPTLDVQTISWLPVSGVIQPLRFRIEPGRNYGMEETLEFAQRTKQNVSLWGPYEVWHGVAHRFRVQKEFLDSGKIGYQCIDSIGEAAKTGLGSDCIHAVADMDPDFGRTRYPLIFFGNSGTANIVGRVMRGPVVIDPPTTHDWLIPRLGLDRYPITRQAYKGPMTPYTPENVAAATERAKKK